MRLLVTFIAAFGCNYVLTRAFLTLLRDRAILALPNERTMHDGAIPKGGGAPLVLVALLTTLLLWPWTPFILTTALAATALGLVSWKDDVNGVSKTVRAWSHVAASIACVLALPSDALVFQGLLPLALDRLVAAGALALFVNFYNFMDGIDGMAGVETLAIAIGYVAVSLLAGSEPPASGLAIAVAGATTAFLFWNWHPARLFLGDVGSVPLGLITGALMLDLAWRTSLAAALVLPLYFMADAGITLVRRLASGEKLWQAHRTHFYQRSTQVLGSHARVVQRVALCNLALIGAAMLTLSHPLVGFFAGLLAVALLLLSLEYTARKGQPPTT